MARVVTFCNTWANTVYVDCAEKTGFCSKISRARTLSFLQKIF